jgi:predicted RNA binding protein YcfA (HicA-like mRNA interferase family)
VPLKVGEVIELLERDGQRLAGPTGSHRHYLHPVKPGRPGIACSAPSDSIDVTLLDPAAV